MNTSTTIIKINGREFTFDFWHTANGLRLFVNEYNGREWETISGLLYPLSTHFECLGIWASEHLGDSVYAETLAEQLGIEMRTSEDADCEKCGAWNHYSEMVFLGGFEYLCQDCHFLATEPATAKGVN